MARTSAAAVVALALLAMGCPAREDARSADAWQATLDRVSRAVVVLRVSVPRAFDTESAAFERATGFVVDA